MSQHTISGTVSFDQREVGLYEGEDHGSMQVNINHQSSKIDLTQYELHISRSLILGFFDLERMDNHHLSLKKSVGCQSPVPTEPME